MPKKRDLLTYKDVPSHPLYSLFLRKNTYTHTPSLWERNETNLTPLGQMVLNYLSVSICAISFYHVPARYWDHSRGQSLRPRACHHALTVWDYDFEQVLTPCCNQNWEEGMGPGWHREGTPDLALEMGRDLPEELRAKLHHHDPSEPCPSRA